MPLVQVFGLKQDVPSHDLIGWQGRICAAIRALPGFRVEEDGEPYVAFVAELLAPLGTDINVVVTGLPDRVELTYPVRAKLAGDLVELFVDAIRPRPQSIRVSVQSLPTNAATAKFRRPL